MQHGEYTYDNNIYTHQVEDRCEYGHAALYSYGTLQSRKFTLNFVVSLTKALQVHTTSTPTTRFPTFDLFCDLLWTYPNNVDLRYATQCPLYKCEGAYN